MSTRARHLLSKLSTLSMVSIFLLGQPLQTFASVAGSSSSKLLKLTTQLKRDAAKWKKQYRRSPNRVVKQVQSYPGAVLASGLRDAGADARAEVFGAYLGEASKYLPPAQWSAIYKKYRGTATGEFKNSSAQSFNLADNYFNALRGTNPNKPNGGSVGTTGRSLSQLMSGGKHTLEVVGNGHSTHQALAIATNNETGQVLSGIVPTVCVSTNKHKPPVARNVSTRGPLTYSLGLPNPQHVAIVNTAERLSKGGKYAKLGLPNAKSQIMQNAIWKIEGEKTGKPEHQITAASIKERVVKNVDCKLPPEVDKAVNQRVNEILSAVDLTIKESKTETAQPPKKEEPPKEGEPVTDGSRTGLDGDPVSGGVTVPPGTTLVPSDDAYQEMMTVNEGTLVPSGGLVFNVNDDPPATRTRGNAPGETGGEKIAEGGDDPPIGLAPPPETQEGIKLGILLTRDDDSWIPENPSNTTVTAQIYEKVGGKWEPSDKKRNITFAFTQCSKEKGECLNSGDDEDFDLEFQPGQNLVVTETEQGGQATTQAPVSTKTAPISCTDFGSFSSIVATAPSCVPLKTVNGEVVEVESNEVMVPKDDNNNQIADAFEDERGMQPNATDDNEDQPVGNGFKGDGYTAYEEYRGFRVKGDHQRTEWLTKDLFIVDDLGRGLAGFPEHSGLTCWLIEESEWQDRVVNFNHGHAKSHRQHGLRIVADSNISGLGQSQKGPPRNVTNNVRVDLDAHGDLPDFFLPDTINHELGHGCGLQHHGPSDRGKQVAIDNKNQPNQLYQFDLETQNQNQVRAGYPEDQVELILHDGTTLAGVDLPSRFRKMTPGNTHSGDVFCFMRYMHEADMIYIKGDEIQVVEGEYDPGRFCTSKNGTQNNAGGNMAGDATNGDCVHQFVVNDLAAFH